jgi:Tfp pilus assembly protein PilF
MKFKNTNKTIPQIGKELNIAYVLEGSVRKLGQRIRITAQLIKVKDGFHLWSEDYNREYNNLFDIWDDIAEKICKSLLENLSIKEISKIKTKRANNLEAYNYYLKAEQVHKKGYLRGQSLRQPKDELKEKFKFSESLFKKAINLDPTYAPSYAGLADLYDSFSVYGTETEEEKKMYRELSAKYTEIAFTLDPTSAQVIFMKGAVCRRKGDLDGNWKYFKRAMELNPNDAYMNYSCGWFMSVKKGLYNHAINFYTKAMELDPLSAAGYLGVRAKMFRLMGKFKLAEKDYQRILELEQKIPPALAMYAYMLYMMKKYGAAEELYTKLYKLYPDYMFTRFLKALQLAVNGEKDKALDIKLEYEGGYNLKYNLYLFLKMKEEAIQSSMEYAEKQKKIGKSIYLYYQNFPGFDFLRTDTRFQRILAEHKKLYEENLRKYGSLRVN